jgi:hypothetical protein
LFEVSQLAAHFGLRGVGIWALGMADDDQLLISALDGFRPAGGPGGAGPQAAPAAPPTAPTTTSSTTSSSTTTTTTAHGATPSTTTTHPAAAAPSTTTTTGPASTGTYDGVTWVVTPVGPGSVDGKISFGTLNNFHSTVPAYSCLDGKSLTVYLYGALTGKYVAVATTPTDCVTQDFVFGG